MLTVLLHLAARNVTQHTPRDKINWIQVNRHTNSSFPKWPLIFRVVKIKRNETKKPQTILQDFVFIIFSPEIFLGSEYTKEFFTDGIQNTENASTTIEYRISKPTRSSVNKVACRDLCFQVSLLFFLFVLLQPIKINITRASKHTKFS